VTENKNLVPPLLIGLGATLWIALALVFYYYTHKPFTVDFISSAVLDLWQIFIGVAIMALSGGIGLWILTNRANFSPLTNIALQAAMGAGLIGLVVFLIGATIGFHISYFAVLLFVGFFLLRRHILHWIKQWTQLKTVFSKNGLVITLAIATGLLLLWTLAVALAPPLHFDALTYHLALPRNYQLSGNIAYTSDNIFWGMPQQIEMLYLFAMGLGGAEAATMLGWGLGALTLIGLLGYLKEMVNLTAAWVAVACLLGGSSLASSLSWGYTEWPVML